MDYKLLCLVLALATSISASQIMTIEPTCFTAGDQLKLKCETLNFASSVFFYLQGVSKGGCSSGGVCLTGITGYQNPSQSGTITEMIISNYDNSRDGGDWTCEYGGASSIVKTVALGNCEVTTEGTIEGILCVGILLAILVLAVCCYFVPIVKIGIILCLWYKHYMRTQKDTYITIIVTAEQKIIKASKIINDGQKEDIPLRGDFHKLTIRVRAGDKIQCAFHTESSVFALIFKIKEEMLNVRIGQTIELPTLLEATPEYSAITFYFNGRDFLSGDHRLKKYRATVDQNTFGEYGIKMTFQKPITICIENIIVQESEEINQAPYWKLMVLFVVIDIVIGVTGGIITGHNRSTDGYCVEVIDIILAVLIPMVIFNVVEVVLIYFMLIKRTGNEESSGSQDPAIPMLRTPTPSTVSPNAETTRSTMGQNNRNWQPPNNNTTVNPDAHQHH